MKKFLENVREAVIISGKVLLLGMKEEELI